MNLRGYTLVFM